MTKPTIAITIGQNHYDRMFNDIAWQGLADFAEITHHPGPEPATTEELIDLLPSADACITSWGVAPLEADVLAAAPDLQALAHMGGSVKRNVSDALWERGIQVTSAGMILAVDVAETTSGIDDRRHEESLAVGSTCT